MERVGEGINVTFSSGVLFAQKEDAIRLNNLSVEFAIFADEKMVKDAKMEAGN